jgi:tRNA(Ile)-lysidine synthetase-like protein
LEFDQRPASNAGPTKSKREIFDADKIGGKILLRHWRAGDRFQPIGLKSAAKLQDLFTNAKIPRGDGATWLLPKPLAAKFSGLKACGFRKISN